MRQTIANRLRRRYIATCLFVIVVVLGLQLSTSTLVFAAAPTATSTPIPIFLTPTPAIHSDYWPTDGWRTSSPEEQQMDSQLLNEMFDAAQDPHIGLHSLLVIRHGYIVSEHYFQHRVPDQLHDLYSVTKSYVSTLVGIAINQGYIDSLDHPVLDYFPDKTFQNVDDRKQAMTLRDLMTMQSGLAWEESLLLTMTQSKDWVTYVLSLPMVAKPGTQFKYCTGCSHIVSAIIQKATNMSTLEFAQKNLFQPLGITDISWRLDPQKIPSGGTDLRMSTPNMAKLGYLFLHNGQWDGQTIVSSEWVQAATSALVKIDSDINYGLMWWTYPSGKAFIALGYNGQTILVIPDLDLIVVTTASTSDHLYDEIAELVKKYVIPAVQDASVDFSTS